MMPIGTALVLGLGAGWTNAFAASSTLWNQVQRATGEDDVVDFARAIAVSGKTALICGNFKNPTPDNPYASKDAAFVFTQADDGTWSEVQRLVPDDDLEQDAFCHALAMDGSIAVVGAQFADVNGNDMQGAVYVFSNADGTWKQVGKLVASDGAASDLFGASVAISGNTIVVGAPHADVNGHLFQGAAYIFTGSGTTWTQTQKLIDPDGGSGATFGYDVAFDGTTVMVGDPSKFKTADAPGAVFVFTDTGGGGYTQSTILFADDGQDEDDFGKSVDVLDGVAIIGAPEADIGGNEAQGAAYVFSASSGGAWTQTAKLLSSDGAADDNFGDAVAVGDTVALVGASGARVSDTNTDGAAYIFNAAGDDWTQSQKLVGINDGLEFVFGASVAIDGSNALVSAYNLGTIERAVYFYSTSAESNQPPVAIDAALETDENKAAIGTLRATDADGDTLTFSIIEKPAHGAVKIDGATTGDYTYTPNDGYSGDDSFTFKASDGTADSNTGTVTITVTPAATGGSSEPGPTANPPVDSSSGGGGALGLMGLLLLGTMIGRRQS